jgi:hypothetical protein
MQLRGQADKQREADAKTAQLIQTEGKSTDAEDRAKISADFGRQLASKAPATAAPFSLAGNVSDTFKKAGSDTALGVQKYGQDLAGNMADMQAPFAQRLRDQLTMGRYKTDINQIGRFNRGDTFLSNMRLNAIRGDPKLAAFSSIAGAASKAGFGAAAPTGPGTGSWEAAPNLTNNLPDIFDFNGAAATRNLPFNYYAPTG